MALFAPELEALRKRKRFRALMPAQGIDFSSNDYLGFSRHPALLASLHEALDKDGAAGAGASRLLRGHHAAHAELEKFAADFFDSPKALYFGSGFLANFALFSTLPSRHDAVIMDERIHASVKEGVHAGTAQAYKAQHNDLENFSEILKRARAKGAQRIFIAVESVYSMDGDLAPLPDLFVLAREHDAILVVDEAHATGIFGPEGRGLSEGLTGGNLIVVHTCGKALGVAGALVTGASGIIDFLINADRKSTRLNSSHVSESRMPSSA